MFKIIRYKKYKSYDIIGHNNIRVSNGLQGIHSRSLDLDHYLVRLNNKFLIKGDLREDSDLFDVDEDYDIVLEFESIESLKNIYPEYFI